MELITILNRCHRFRGFVDHRARFSPDHKSIEVSVRPRKGSTAVCSRCHQAAPGYDQLAERRFEFIPLWGFFVFLLYAMRRVNCRRCGVVEGLNNKVKVTMRKSYDSAPTECWNWHSITHLASYRSPNPPTISSDESLNLSERQVSVVRPRQ